MSFISNIFSKRKRNANGNPIKLSGKEASSYFSSTLCLVRKGINNSNYNFIFSLEQAKDARESNGTVPNYCPNLAWLIQDINAIDKVRMTKVLSNHITELSSPSHISDFLSVRYGLFKIHTNVPKDIHTSEVIALLYLDLIIHTNALETPLEYLLAYKSLTQKYELPTLRIASKDLMELLELVEFKKFSNKETLINILESLFKEYLVEGFKNYPQGFSSPEHRSIVECLSELINTDIFRMRYFGEEFEDVRKTLLCIMDAESLNTLNPIIKLYNERIKTATCENTLGFNYN